jgi:threonylcarbamoyladenosine tRNA methylthiotransferase MtaB
MICGFPGESAADHAQSLAFCRELGFARIHVFRFSARKGTPAAERSDQIDAGMIAKRSREMRILAHQLTRLDAEARIGSVEAVCIEGAGWGRSESYHRVRVPSQLQVGLIVPMRFCELHDTLIHARPLAMSELSDCRNEGADGGACPSITAHT